MQTRLALNNSDQVARRTITELFILGAAFVAAALLVTDIFDWHIQRKGHGHFDLAAYQDYLRSYSGPQARLIDISGGTVNIGELSTGNATGAGSAITHIRGGNVTIENILTFFSNSTGIPSRLGQDE